MEWLNQNWTYLLLLVSVIPFMRFAGMGCGFGGRRTHPSSASTQPGGPMDTVSPAADRGLASPASSLDPVCGMTVQANKAAQTVGHRRDAQHQHPVRTPPDQRLPAVARVKGRTQRLARRTARQCR